MPRSGIYLAALEAGFVAALYDGLALISKLAADPVTASDPKLTDAVELARKATGIELTIARSRLTAAIATSRDGGIQLAEPPTDADGWQSWLDRLEQQPNVDKVAMTLGRLGGALARAWGLAERVAYLRAAAPDLPALVEAASSAVTATRGAWQHLQRGLATSGRALVDARRPKLEKWMGFAPAADAVKSTQFSGGAYEEIIDWRKTLDLHLRAFATDLAAPLPTAPTADATDLEKRLVAAIFENPDDESALRRFAQFASQRGDERGEVVRLQLDFPRGSAEHARALQITMTHPEWKQPLEDLGATDIVFVRGFPRDITIGALAFLEHAAALFERAPIRTLRLRNGAGAALARIAVMPPLARLTGLDLANQGVTDEGVAALAASPHVGNIRFLKLDQNSITDAGVDALASATRTKLRSLRTVNLQLNKASDPVDRTRHVDETNTETVPTPEGIALEQKYGALPWLHPD